MTYVLQIITNALILLLSVVQVAMMVRAILSWFPIDSNKFTDFLHGLTEPFIYPIRVLFQKMNWFQNFPIDLSFMAAFLLVDALMIFLMWV